MKRKKIMENWNWIKKTNEGLKGKYVFLLFSFLAGNLLIMGFSVIALLILLIIVLRIYFTKQGTIIYLSILSFVCALVYFGNIKLNESKGVPHKEHVTTLILRVFPDEIKVDGDSVSTKATVAEKGKREKIQIFYTLKNEKEKEYWSTLEKTIYVKVVGIKKKPETARNLNGFDYQYFLKSNGIYAIVQAESINIIPTRATSNFVFPIQWLKEKRKHFSLKIEKNAGYFTSIYMKIFLLGIKDQEFLQMRKKLNGLGLLHVFSLSGIHVYFYLNLFRYVLLRLNRTVESVFKWQLLFLWVCFWFTGSTIGIGRSTKQIGFTLCNKKFKWDTQS